MVVKVKSRSKIRKRAGAGESASYFRFARLIHPHYIYYLRAWHRLQIYKLVWHRACLHGASLWTGSLFWERMEKSRGEGRERVLSSRFFHPFPKQGASSQANMKVGFKNIRVYMQSFNLAIPGITKRVNKNNGWQTTRDEFSSTLTGRSYSNLSVLWLL